MTHLDLTLTCFLADVALCEPCFCMHVWFRVLETVWRRSCMARTTAIFNPFSEAAQAPLHAILE